MDDGGSPRQPPARKIDAFLSRFRHLAPGARSDSDSNCAEAHQLLSKRELDAIRVQFSSSTASQRRKSFTSPPSPRELARKAITPRRHQAAHLLTWRDIRDRWNFSDSSQRVNESLQRSESMVSLACFRSLVNYIKDDDVDGLQRYLTSNKHAIVDDKDDNGTTALMVACEKGSGAMVSTLLANGADPRAQDADGWGPLALASKRGALDIINDLLRKGADVTHRDMGGWTALMWACYKGHADAVAALAAAGADANAAAACGVTALMWACGRGHSAAAERALAAGARAAAADRHGTTALVWAARAGDAAAARALLRKGAAAAIDAPGLYSWTPLLQAAAGNHLEIVQMLLEYKPNLNALDKDGCTALILACKEGFYDIAIALITAGAYINIQDRDNDTCLIHATKGGHKAIVEALLKKYADVDALGKDRKTAIYTAAEKGHTAIVKLLLQANPDLELATKDGDTPLLRAVRTRNADIVQMLVDKKSRIQASDKRGDTALHIAMRARSKAIVEILLRNPKNSQLLYRPNRQQETPYNIDLSYPKTILGQIFGARKLNTNEDNENMLGYGLYSSALADMLSEPSLSVPITVGLYARWGSGKSFLLNKLKEEMKSFARQWGGGGGGAGEARGGARWAGGWALAHAALAAAACAAAAAGVGWAAALAAAAAALAALAGAAAALDFAARKYDWYWSQTLIMNLSHKFDSLKLVLQVMFCHPPGPQSSLTLPAQPIRFHFTDQAKGCTQEGEASVVQMIVSLSEALENQYGKICTRLYRAFRPKPIRATASWRWRRACCIPHIIAFEICFICAVVGLSALIFFYTNKDVSEQTHNIQQGLFIAVGGFVSLIAIANIYTWGRMASALFFSPRAHVKSSIKRQPEGFLQALRPEVALLTDMIRCLDAFTGQQTRLVVVVDALDSCEQDRVLVVLNAIHSLCSEVHSPFIVLLAIDPHIISKAVEVNSRRAFSESNIGGWDYLRNMVQLPFYLQNSTLRRVEVARHAASKRLQVYNDDFGLQRSVSARRLSTASEIMASQERKPAAASAGAAVAARARRLRPSESLASSMASGLHRLAPPAAPAPTAGDLSRVLLTDDYFSDVNPRSMTRLMNVIYVTGRLLKAFKIEFNYYSLASWINLTEQWPFRTSWIIFHYETYEEHIDDNTPLKQIYEKVKPNIPTLRDAEPLMDLDRDERKLDIFLGVHRTSLLAADLKIFLPFTINLDPYIKKVIKDEHQQLENLEDDSNMTAMPFMGSAQKSLPSTSKVYQLQQRKQKPPVTPPMINQGASWMNWMGSPQPYQQDMMQQTPQFNPFQSPYPQLNAIVPYQPNQSVSPKENFTGLEDLSDVRLSQLSVDGVCKIVESILGGTRSNVMASALQQNNICGRVLSYCDLGELKQALNLNFGDWETLKMLILALKEIEMTIPNPPPLTDRSMDNEKETKQRPIIERERSKPSNMEKQVTMEEQMICGALQTLNEEAMEDVLQGDSTSAGEDGELQSMLLAPSSSAVWQGITPPGSISSTPHLPRKFEQPILKTSASFKSNVKKHVYINDYGSNFGSQQNLRNGEIPGIVFRYEDDGDTQNEPIMMKLDKSSANDVNLKLHLSDESHSCNSSTSSDSDIQGGKRKVTSEIKPPSKLKMCLTKRSKSFKKPSEIAKEKETLHSNLSQSIENNLFLNYKKAKISPARSMEKLSKLKDKIFPNSSVVEVPSRGLESDDDEGAPLFVAVSSNAPERRLPLSEKSLDVACADYSFPETDASPYSESSLVESSSNEKDAKALPSHSIVDDSVEMTFTEDYHKKARAALVFHMESEESLSNMLEPYQLDLISPGSDSSARSGLWRQDALDNQDEWAEL